MVSKSSLVLQIVQFLSKVFLFVHFMCILYPILIFWAVILWPLSILHIQVHVWLIDKLIYIMTYSIVAWIHTSGHKCYEVGEDISSCYDDNCLVISNHPTTFDPILLMYAFLQKGNVYNQILWILQPWIKLTPLGFATWLRNDFFIKNVKDERQYQLIKLQKHVLLTNCTEQRRRRRWIALFPEGGLLMKGIPKSQCYAKENNLPILQHVSLPRIGAFQSILSTLHPNNNSSTNEEENFKSRYKLHEKVRPLKWIIDVTIGYKPKANLPRSESLTLLPVTPTQAFLYYQLYPIDDIPNDAKGMETWLYDKFLKNDEILKEFYETGAFPLKSKFKNGFLSSAKCIPNNGWSIIFGFLFQIISLLFLCNIIIIIFI